MLNKWVGYKYESDGGIGLVDVFSILSLLEQPAIAKDHILRWIVYNYLVGNNDAHGKNLAFLVDAHGIRLAPFYDLLCVQAYLPESVMAMSIEEENKPGWIGSSHWQALAKQAAVPERLLRSYLKKQVDEIEASANKLLMLDEFTDEERLFLRGSVLPVIRQRIAFTREV